jgi:glycosyltransferase involved in cell wall biosynthesis
MLETMPKMVTIHHGVDTWKYQFQEKKQDYLAFLGRFAPVKGAHLAIEAAKRAGIPLKMAGEIQPVYQSYFDAMVKPHIDGKFIEYVGEADLSSKNELLASARAMLFPIQWNEPFGLVLIESMACGTPVLALPGGSVPEIVKPGVSGEICRDVNHLADAAKQVSYDAHSVRRYCEENFSVDVMTSKYVELYKHVYAESAFSTPAVSASEVSNSYGEEAVA